MSDASMIFFAIFYVAGIYFSELPNTVKTMMCWGMCAGTLTALMLNVWLKTN